MRARRVTRLLHLSAWRDALYPQFVWLM
jgi:hypothetical protein